ncbi:MAG TPA: hypothetical protein VLA91_03540 [Acidimicrobiia bacterium]|nr:hypothetical protein [Acidimicrobiia bacterium]
MRGRDQTFLSDLIGPEDQAIEAVVSRYQRVAPAVTRFARSLSQNPNLRVRLGSEAAASSDEVVCDPRIFQAAYHRNAPVTPDEVAIASALHEVMHLVSTNLDEKRPLPEGWPVEGEPASEAEVDLLTALERTNKPVAEVLFFSLEDARQEAQGLAMYPGARSVLEDLYLSSLGQAISRSGSLSQFVLGCFLLTGGYVERDLLERRFDPRAATAIDDATHHCELAADSDDPWDVAHLALELEAIARAHGLITEVPASATNAQRQMAAKDDAEKATDGVDSLRLTTPILSDADSYQDTRRSAEARSGISDRKGASDIAGEESTDQLLRVSQAPDVFLPTGQGGKLVVGPIPSAFSRFSEEGVAALTETARRWGLAQRRVSGELFPLFAANQRRGLRSGFDQGDVSPHAALFIGAGLYQRLYERRAARTRRTYAVSLLVDASASMLSPGKGPGISGTSWAMPAAMLGAWTMAHLCDELQIDFEVALFNRGFAAAVEDTESSYRRKRSAATAGLRRTQGTAADRLTSTVNHYMVKPFERRWRDSESALAGLFYTAAQPKMAATLARRDPNSAPPVSLFEKAANVDEFNLIHAAERMGRLGAQVRVLMVLADGMTRGSLEALAKSVAAVESGGTTVIGIGIGDHTVDEAYRRHEVVSRPEDLAGAMINGTRNALRRSLALWGMDTWWLRASDPTTNQEIAVA